jgi:hypothetical protein
LTKKKGESLSWWVFSPPAPLQTNPDAVLSDGLQATPTSQPDNQSASAFN